jgi:hypothetical protein
MSKSEQDGDYKLVYAGEEPCVSVMCDEFKRAGGVGTYSARRSRADMIRFNLWPGRSSDYKKHRKALNKEPIPWENAWDGRVYTADGIVEDLGDVLSNAHKRAQLKAKATNAGDLGKADAFTKVVQKYVERDRSRIAEEADFMWQFGLGYGQSVWQVMWERSIGMEMKRVTMEELNAAAGQAAMMLQKMAPAGGAPGVGLRAGSPHPGPLPGGEGGPAGEQGDDGAGGDSAAPGGGGGGGVGGGKGMAGLDLLSRLPELVMDDSKEATDKVAGIVQTFAGSIASQLYAKETVDYGDEFLENYSLSMAEARRVVKDLRENGKAELPAPYLEFNGPRVVAREVGVDYFCPPETQRVQDARWHLVREWLPPEDILEMQACNGWNADWCEAAIKTQGQVSYWGNETDLENLVDLDGEEVSSFNPVDTKSGLVEVCHFFKRYVTEAGVPQVWCTVFCPHATNDASGKEIWARHYALNYARARSPFIGYRFQAKKRAFQSSKGVPEIVGCDQASIKRSLDMLVDRQDMETNPPWLVNSRLAMRYKAGPGRLIPQAREGDLKSMDLVTGSPELALELVKDARFRLDNYFGLMTENVLPAKWQTKLQALAGRFLDSAAEMYRLYGALICQFASDEDLALIAENEAEFPRSMEEIRGEYDVGLYFDVKDLDMEFTFKKLDAIIKMAIPIDRAGVIDSGRLVPLILNAIDPTMGMAVMSDRQGASQKMFNEVKQQVALMYVGNEADYVENDPTAKQKLEFLQQIVQANPVYLQALGSFQTGTGGGRGPMTEDGGRRTEVGGGAEDMGRNMRFAELLDKYQKNLTQSVKQDENKMRGRLGV